jgi:hypothetical protein
MVDQAHPSVEPDLTTSMTSEHLTPLYYWEFATCRASR